MTVEPCIKEMINCIVQSQSVLVNTAENGKLALSLELPKNKSDASATSCLCRYFQISGGIHGAKQLLQTATVKTIP